MINIARGVSRVFTPRVSFASFRSSLLPHPLPSSSSIVSPSSSLHHIGIRTIKTKSSVKKRLHMTGSGKIKRWQSNKRHINSKQNRKKIRQLGDSKMLKGYQKDLGKRLLGLK
jgi:ribosomal protein L35